MWCLGWSSYNKEVTKNASSTTFPSCQLGLRILMMDKRSRSSQSRTTTTSDKVPSSTRSKRHTEQAEPSTSMNTNSTVSNTSTDMWEKVLRVWQKQVGVATRWGNRLQWMVTSPDFAQAWYKQIVSYPPRFVSFTSKYVKSLPTWILDPSETPSKWSSRLDSKGSSSSSRSSEQED